MRNIKARILDVYLEEHNKHHDLALDWFIASWDKEGAEKKLCLSNYKKYKKKAKRITARMLKYLNG